MPQPTRPQAGAACAALPPLVAKDERARVTAALAQLGQRICSEFELLRISFLKRSPQV